MEYSTGSGTEQPREDGAADRSAGQVCAKNGKDALKDFDGIFFLYAGGRVQTTRGRLYWPHRASVTHQGKRWPYFICRKAATG